MNTIYKISIIMMLFCIITGCEKRWDAPYYEGDYLMNVQIYVEDSMLYGNVYPVSDKLNSGFLGNNSPNSILSRSVKSKFRINEGQEMELEYDASKEKERFEYKHVFSPGDKIDIQLSQHYYGKASASVIMPDKPQIEAEYIGNKTNGTDTLMQIKIRIKDNGEHKNYYILNAISYSYNKYFADRGHDTLNYTQWVSQSDHFFKSDAPIFIDYNVKRNSVGEEWNLYKTNREFPEFFSHIFSDKLFNGKEYEFTVEIPIVISRLEEESNEYIKFTKLSSLYYAEIRLSQLSESYFNYHKAWEYSEPNASTFHYTNLDGAIGVFGAISKGDVIRFYFKEKSLE